MLCINTVRRRLPERVRSEHWDAQNSGQRRATLTAYVQDAPSSIRHAPRRLHFPQDLGTWPQKEPPSQITRTGICAFTPWLFMKAVKAVSPFSSISGISRFQLLMHMNHWKWAEANQYFKNWVGCNFIRPIVAHDTMHTGISKIHYWCGLFWRVTFTWEIVLLLG